MKGQAYGFLIAPGLLDDDRALGESGRALPSEPVLPASGRAIH